MLIHTLKTPVLFSTCRKHQVNPQAWGSSNIGLIVFEENLSALDNVENLARARKYDRIIVGSTWNRLFLQGKGHRVLRN
jgi:hypothetical protein